MTRFTLSIALSFVVILSRFSFPVAASASTSPIRCGGSKPYYLVCTKLPATDVNYYGQFYTGNNAFGFSNALTQNDYYAAAQEFNEQFPSADRQTIKESSTCGAIVNCVTMSDKTFYASYPHYVSGCESYYYHCILTQEFSAQAYAPASFLNETVTETRIPAMPPGQKNTHGDFAQLYRFTAITPMMAVLTGGLETYFNRYFTSLFNTAGDPDRVLHAAIVTLVSAFGAGLLTIFNDWNNNPEIVDTNKAGFALNEGAMEAQTASNALVSAENGSLGKNHSMFAAVTDILNAKPDLTTGTIGAADPNYVNSLLQSDIDNAFLRALPVYPVETNYYYHLLDRFNIFVFAFLSALNGNLFTATLSSTLP